MSASRLDWLRSGRDPNDSSWVILRYPDDWRSGVARDVSYDARRQALELAVAPPSDQAAGWWPNQPVTAPDGMAYRIDGASGRLLWKRVCDTDFSPVPGLGAPGFATGQLRGARGLAADGAGRLLVADSGNGRVQVLLPHDGAVLVVLDAGLVRPVDMVVDAEGAIHVLDAGTGRIHCFDARFTPQGSFAPGTLDPWSGAPWGSVPSPDFRAIAAPVQGELVLFDTQRPALWHMTTEGNPLPALPWPSAADLPPGWPAIAERYAARGELVLGPLDGGIYNLAWHRMLVDADVPEGTAIRLQTVASNSNSLPSFPWAPIAPVPLTAADVASRDADRLVLPDILSWQRWHAGVLQRWAEVPLHVFGGDGPINGAAITLPAEAARWLRVGDSLVFQDAQGTRAEARITAIPDRTLTVAASGQAAAFTGDGPIELLARASGAIGYGPLSLDFTRVARSATGLAGLARNGFPEPLVLPHALGALLAAGDLLGLGTIDAQVEVLDSDPADVVVTLDAPVAGDWSTSSLLLTQTPGRLVVTAPNGLAGEVPAGAQIAVMDDIQTASAEVRLIDPTTASVWLAAPLAGPVTGTSWETAQFSAPSASDRGRYLWLRIQLSGATVSPSQSVGASSLATASPAIRAIRIVAPRPSLTAWLPAIFSRRDPDNDPPGANFLERFLTLFEGQLTGIEGAYESISRLLNPAATDQEWLDFLAAWMDIAFDPSWPLDRRRQIVREGYRLQAGQGTPAALRRYLEIYTGAPATISEAFLQRPADPIQLGARGALGVATLAGAEGARSQDDAIAHRFTVSVSLPDAPDRTTARDVVQRIIQTMKPAHTAYRLDVDAGLASAIGISGAVGEIVIPGADADPCGCDPDLNPWQQPGQVTGKFLIGGRLGRSGTPQMLPTGE